MECNFSPFREFDRPTNTQTRIRVHLEKNTSINTVHQFTQGFVSDVFAWIRIDFKISLDPDPVLAPDPGAKERVQKKL